MSTKAHGGALFLAGALFTTGLLLTCTEGKPPAGDGGPMSRGGDGAGVQVGGDARAAGGPGWEYAMAGSVAEIGPTTLDLPNGSTQEIDCGSPPDPQVPPRPSRSRELCFLNKVGADGWELVQAQYIVGTHAGFIFRRPK